MLKTYVSLGEVSMVGVVLRVTLPEDNLWCLAGGANVRGDEGSSSIGEVESTSVIATPGGVLETLSESLHGVNTSVRTIEFIVCGVLDGCKRDEPRRC